MCPKGGDVVAIAWPRTEGGAAADQILPQMWQIDPATRAHEVSANPFQKVENARGIGHVSDRRAKGSDYGGTIMSCWINSVDEGEKPDLPDHYVGNRLGGYGAPGELYASVKVSQGGCLRFGKNWGAYLSAGFKAPHKMLASCCRRVRADGNNEAVPHGVNRSIPAFVPVAITAKPPLPHDLFDRFAELASDYF
ncbi:hypothetical protein AA11237_3498 [Acidocella aminolytica 101 = DSM 11237]|nr:hypothetical protein AA11237_3498 [Acidocella aminolytica 101 = DSM 11237]